LPITPGRAPRCVGGDRDLLPGVFESLEAIECAGIGLDPSCTQPQRSRINEVKRIGDVAEAGEDACVGHGPMV